MDKKKPALSLKNKVDLIKSLRKGIRTQVSTRTQDSLASALNKACESQVKFNQSEKSSMVTKTQLQRKMQSDVDKALLKWYHSVPFKGQLPRKQPQFMKKAKELAEEMGYEFSPDASWLKRWFTHHDIKVYKPWETPTSNLQEAAQYRNNVLPGLLHSFNANDIVNANAYTFYYKARPFLEVDEQVRNRGEGQVTLLFMCNATGTNKRVIVLGDPTSHASFNEADIPLAYYMTPSILVTADLWTNILKNLDDEMGATSRKIILFTSDIECRQVNTTYNNIELHFLPPNTAALTEPLERGIFISFKEKYYNLLQRQMHCAFERGETEEEFMNSVTPSFGMGLIKAAWDRVRKSTIQGSFRNAGFITLQNGSTLEMAMDTADSDEESDKASNEPNECNIKVENEAVEDEEEEKFVPIKIVSEKQNKVNQLKTLYETEKIPTPRAAFCALNILATYCAGHGLYKSLDSVHVIETELLNFAKKSRLANYSEF